MRRFLIAVATVVIAGSAAYAGGKDKSGHPKTAVEVYKKQVADRIGESWYAKVDLKRDMIAIGSIRMRYRIVPNNRVRDLKVLSNSSNQTFANVCIAAVLEAKIPPMPQELRRQVGERGVDFDDTFTMRQN